MLPDPHMSQIASLNYKFVQAQYRYIRYSCYRFIHKV